MSEKIPPPRLRMTGIRKRFGGVVALDGVDLQVAPGEVHALIGENGAGKSTLMKTLSGAIRADAGDMVLDGEPYQPANPADARRRGVAMIYQELNLAPHLSVLANVMLGDEESRFGFLEARRMEKKVKEALALLHHPDISPHVPVRKLSISAQQLVEVARALVSNARTIVFDEPTSSLTRKDTAHLFQVIRRLRDRGVSVVYISHFLEEVREISDRFTVLRDGRTVGSGDISSTPLGRIVELMVGRSVEEMFPRTPHTPGEPILEVRRLAGYGGRPRAATFSLRRGEILGVFGLVGAGRTETLRSIFGLSPVKDGEVSLAGRGSITGFSPTRAIRSGLGLLSENRKEEGLLLRRSVAENAALSDYRRMAVAGWVPPRREREAAARLIKMLEIKTRGPEARISALSGGNQQKVALARLLQQDADVLLLDEPTRGIDVGSKVQIYQLVGRLAASGKAILFVSSYLPELLGVADRIAVMARGTVADVKPVEEWNEESIMLAATKGD